MSSSPSLIIAETEGSEFDESGSLPGIDLAEPTAAPIPEPTLTNNSKPLEPTDLDSVDSVGCGAAPFETDFLTEIIQNKDIPVRVQTDSTGRSYYYFNNSTIVVVFEVLGKKMVNISSTILALDTLLSLKQCIHHKPSGVHPLEQIEFRSTPIPASWFGSVECTFSDGETLVINDLSIDLMMNIVSHLSSVYDKEPTETKLTKKTSVPPQQIINVKVGSHVPTLSAGFLLGASLTTIGYFLGKYKY